MKRVYLFLIFSFLMSHFAGYSMDSLSSANAFSDENIRNESSQGGYFFEFSDRSHKEIKEFLELQASALRGMLPHLRKRLCEVHNQLENKSSNIGQSGSTLINEPVTPQTIIQGIDSVLTCLEGKRDCTKDDQLRDVSMAILASAAFEDEINILISSIKKNDYAEDISYTLLKKFLPTWQKGINKELDLPKKCLAFFRDSKSPTEIYDGYAIIFAYIAAGLPVNEVLNYFGEEPKDFCDSIFGLKTEGTNAAP